MSTELTNLLFKEYTEILESSDIEILVGEEPNVKIFRLHSFILKVRSPYFRTALSSDWIKIEDNIIKFQKPNISVKVFEILVKYIYNSKLELESNDVKTNVALLIAADELCLNDLCIFIEEYLLKDKELLKQHFVLIQHVANMLTQYTKLIQFYKETYQQDPSLIFKANDFTTLKREYLLELLIKSEHILKPIEVWDKVVEWCIAQSEELPTDITSWTVGNISLFGALTQSFIPHINFKEIGRSNFFQKIQPFEKIFDVDFYVEIREYYSLDNIYSHYNVKVDKIDSNIIDLNYAFLIASWIKLMKKHQSTTCEFKLLVRGSRSGFDKQTFHRYCDNKGPTVTIVRINGTNEILGGYNPLNWTSPLYLNYCRTKESFIFSFDKNNLDNYIFSKVIDVEHAICNFYLSGPNFGLKDLYNNSRKGRCHRNSYEKLIRRSSEEFILCDYEVFQITT